MARNLALTRRKFVARSAQAGAGLALASRFPLGSAAAEPVQPLPERQLAALAAPGMPAPPFADADYWRFSDWIAPYFDGLWLAEKSLYVSGNSTVGRIYHNALLLTTHAVAALAGHTGPSRNDVRAVLLARRLCDSPPWSERVQPVEPDPQFHTPGWVESMSTQEAAMDKSIDPKVAEALMYAWRARDIIGLPRETADLIADRVSRCARGPFFRFPAVRLNQINWNCELYAHNATITGDTELLLNDYRAQVARFAIGIRQAPSPGGSPNLGPGYRFHYLPGRPPTHPFNLDSAEYASETVHFLLYYEQALRAGMAPLAPEHVELLRAWVEHIVYGYWTHGGYLNWDTGYGFKRWHAGRTWALAQQGLLAIVSAPRFHANPSVGQWAKYMFDRGLALYERLSREAADAKGIAPSNLYDIALAPLGPSIRDLFAARMQANAARAVALGLGSKPAAQPPPLYSFDGDIGRLTVTTPVYSTAVLAVNQRAIPYGGVELARLYDGDQRVVSNVGGRPWASFGVLVRDSSAKEILLSQRPKPKPPRVPPVELLRSPRGRVRIAKPYPKRPYGGPFETIVARGRAVAPEVAVETTHRFQRDWIQTSWRIARRTRGRYSVDVLFPSWGKNATVEAILAGGKRVTLAGPGRPRRRVSLAKVAYFYVAGEDAGYVMLPVDRRPKAVAHVLRPRAQSSSPRPGPTLALQLARSRKFDRLGLAMRIAPARNAAEAALVVRSLGLGRRPAKRRKARR
jgi:hypothetical protein